MFLAILLFKGEWLAVVLAEASLLTQGYSGDRLAGLLGDAVLAVYVQLAIWQGKLPFAASLTNHFAHNRVHPL